MMWLFHQKILLYTVTNIYVEIMHVCMSVKKHIIELYDAVYIVSRLHWVSCLYASLAKISRGYNTIKYEAFGLEKVYVCVCLRLFVFVYVCVCLRLFVFVYVLH